MLFLFCHIRLSSIAHDEVYHSPSRESPEKIYATPSEEEWYSESPPRKSLLPATVRKMNEEMEAATSPECNDWDPTGKTPDEMTAWCANYERESRLEMAGARKVHYFISVHTAMTEA